MATLKKGYVYEVTFRGRDKKSGKPVVNVQHYRVHETGTADDYGDVEPTSNHLFFLASLKTSWLDAIQRISDHYVAVDVTVREISSITVSHSPSGKLVRQWGFSAIYTSAFSADQGGATAGEACPLFVSISIRAVTTFPGRSGRGGTHLAPVCELTNENGRISPDELVGFQGNWDTFKTAVSCSGGVDPVDEMTPVVASKKLARSLTGTSIFLESGTWAHDVDRYAVNPNTGSQTSRKPRLDAVVGLGV